MSKLEPRTVQLTISAPLQDVGAEAPPPAAAYVFGASGFFLGAAELDCEGRAVLHVPAGAEATALRVVVGPRLTEGSGEPELAELVRRGAVEQAVRVEAAAKELALELPIYRESWRSWLQRCLVRGRLLQRSTPTPGGPVLDLPIYGATVEIYEVDPLRLVLPRLPQPILDRLRLELASGPVPPRPELEPIVRLEPNALRRTPALQDRAGAPTDDDADALADDAPAAALPAEQAALREAALRADDAAFLQAMLATPLRVMHLICKLAPLLVTKQRIASATTDAQGRFRVTIWKSLFNPDQPDLYFRALQTPLGAPTQVLYAPSPVACHTWWNYRCGTEVTLISTHPGAVTTLPTTPVEAGVNWALFTAIGNTSLARIFGAGAAGATAANLGLLDTGAPWGGVLRPRLDFDSRLRDVQGLRYYQLSYRRGTSGAFTPLTAAVARHYAVFNAATATLTVKRYELGPHPEVVGGEALQLFEIPPTVPPEGQWTVANGVLDTEAGELPSPQISRGLAYTASGAVVPGTVDESGLYQLKVELFTAAKQRVSLAGGPGQPPVTWYVPTTPSLAGTITTAAASTIAQPGGGSLIVGDALVLTLHVDNNQTWAGLGAPTTPSGAADACCGVLRYAAGAQVTVPYEARHVHGHARHGMHLSRSATELVATSGGAGTFTLVRSVATLMSQSLPASCGGVPCTTAAFAEHLDVAATATDGWGSNLGYDSSATRAFALAPSGTP